MGAGPTERVRRVYDAQAQDYDRVFAVAERRLLGHHRAWATSRAEGSVLELCVGTGLDLPLYGPRVERVLGVDLSEGMLAVARSRRQSLGPDTRVELRCGDVEALDLPDACVDAVIATYALCTVPDPGSALAEARRVLRPGGRLLLVDHGPSSSRAVRAVQRLLDPVTVRWQADHLLRDPRRLVLDAGFAVVEADRAGRAGLVHRVHARSPS